LFVAGRFRLAAGRQSAIAAVIVVIDVVWRLLRTLVDAQWVGWLVFADGLFGTQVTTECTRTTFVVAVDIVEPIERTRIDARGVGTEREISSCRLTVAYGRTIVAVASRRPTIAVLVRIVQLVEGTGVLAVEGSIAICVVVGHTAATYARGLFVRIVLAQIDAGWVLGLIIAGRFTGTLGVEGTSAIIVVVGVVLVVEVAVVDTIGDPVPVGVRVDIAAATLPWHNLELIPWTQVHTTRDCLRRTIGWATGVHRTVTICVVIAVVVSV